MKALWCGVLLAVTACSSGLQGSKNCTEAGGRCLSPCPSGTQPPTPAQLEANLDNFAYACPADAGLSGVACCLPVPVTN